MISSAFSRRLNIATLVTLAMLSLWLLLDSTLTATIWDGMTISQSAVQVEYCEFNHPHRVFHQPINTYSNLAYLFFGVFILLVAYQDQQNHGLRATNRMADFPLLSGLMGACFVYLCLGSAFFHASLTYVGQRVDMNATYSILLTLVGITIYHVFHKLQLTPSQQRLWVVGLLALIGLWAPLALLVPSSRLVPVLILLLNVGMLVNYVQFRARRSVWLVLLSFVLIVLAIYIRTMDVRKINCDPYSYYQGHALWHVLTALSSFCSYCFFRFDKAKSPGRP